MVDVNDDVAVLLETGTKAQPAFKEHFGRVQSIFVRQGHRNTRRRHTKPVDLEAPPHGAEFVLDHCQPLSKDLKSWRLVDSASASAADKAAGHVDAKAHPARCVHTRVTFEPVEGKPSQYTTDPAAALAVVQAAVDKTQAAQPDKQQRADMAEARRRMLANQQGDGCARVCNKRKGDPRGRRGTDVTPKLTPAPAACIGGPSPGKAASPHRADPAPRDFAIFHKPVTPAPAVAPQISVDLAATDTELLGAVFAQDACIHNLNIANLVLTLDDLRTAVGSEWLNDHLINAFLSTLAVTGRRADAFKETHVFSTYFWTLYSNNQHNPARMKTWGRKHIDWTGVKTATVLLPVHWPGHWALGIIDVRNRKVHCLDSLPDANRKNTFLQHAIGYCNYKAGDVGQAFSAGTLKSSVQLDGCACGVFTCINAAEYVAAGEPPAVFQRCTQDSVPEHRQHIVAAVHRAAAA